MVSSCSETKQIAVLGLFTFFSFWYSTQLKRCHTNQLFCPFSKNIQQHRLCAFDKLWRLLRWTGCRIICFKLRCPGGLRFRNPYRPASYVHFAIVFWNRFRPNGSVFPLSYMYSTGQNLGATLIWTILLYDKFLVYDMKKESFKSCTNMRLILSKMEKGFYKNWKNEHEGCNKVQRRSLKDSLRTSSSYKLFKPCFCSLRNKAILWFLEPKRAVIGAKVVYLQIWRQYQLQTTMSVEPIIWKSLFRL